MAPQHLAFIKKQLKLLEGKAVTRQMLKSRLEEEFGHDPSFTLKKIGFALKMDLRMSYKKAFDCPPPVAT